MGENYDILANMRFTSFYDNLGNCDILAKMRFTSCNDNLENCDILANMRFTSCYDNLENCKNMSFLGIIQAEYRLSTKNNIFKIFKFTSSDPSVPWASYRLRRLPPLCPQVCRSPVPSDQKEIVTGTKILCFYQNSLL